MARPVAHVLAFFKESASSKPRKRAEYCFESTVSEKRTQWASLSFGANSVSSARNSVSLLWQTNNRLRGTHWVRSPELSEPRKTHWVRCLKLYSPKPYSARFTPKFAQPCLSRVKRRSSPARGYKFGCVCSSMAGHYPGIPHDRPYRNKHLQICNPSLGSMARWPYSTGLCKFGWVWSSLSGFVVFGWTVLGSSQRY